MAAKGSAGGGGTVTNVNHGQFIQGSTASCVQSGDMLSTICTVTGIVMATHDSVQITFFYCDESACAARTAPTITITDGANTYTQIAGPGPILGGAPGFTMYAFNANDVTGGTRTLTLTVTNGIIANILFYVNIEIVVNRGASLSAAIDSAVTAIASGATGSPSVTAAGAVSTTGELAFCVAAGVTGTHDSPFVQIDPGGNSTNSAASVAPTVSTTPTCSKTTGSGAWIAVLFSVKP